MDLPQKRPGSEIRNEQLSRNLISSNKYPNHLSLTQLIYSLFIIIIIIIAPSDIVRQQDVFLLQIQFVNLQIFLVSHI
jgi:hypothetical protein